MQDTEYHEGHTLTCLLFGREVVPPAQRLEEAVLPEGNDTVPLLKRLLLLLPGGPLPGAGGQRDHLLKLPVLSAREDQREE